MAQLRGGTTIGGNIAWHAGNFQPDSKLDITGGNITGTLTVQGTLVVLANDSRLSDARTPKAHTHAAGDLPNASTSAKGVVQLSTSISSTSTTLAATASAAKAAYDRANEVRTLNATFVLESRTSDPASPMTGQMWLRTDLT